MGFKIGGISRGFQISFTKYKRDHPTKVKDRISLKRLKLGKTQNLSSHLGVTFLEAFF